MRRSVDPPSERGRRNQDLDFLLDEKAFGDGSIFVVQSSVMHSDTELERMFQIGVLKQKFEVAERDSVYFDVL